MVSFFTMLIIFYYVDQVSPPTKHPIRCDSVTGVLTQSHYLILTYGLVCL